MPRPAPRRYGNDYRPPAIDSARAVADVTLFLTGARSLDGVTADQLAHRYRLKTKTAECLLIQEQQRRVRA